MSGRILQHAGPLEAADCDLPQESVRISEVLVRLKTPENPVRFRKLLRNSNLGTAFANYCLRLKRVGHPSPI